MRDPVEHRQLTQFWWGLLTGPAVTAVLLSLVPAGRFKASLPTLWLWLLPLVGLAIGATSLMRLQKFRVLEATGDALRVRAALMTSAGLANVPMMSGVVCYVSGGGLAVLWAMCAASFGLIWLFRPRS